MSIDPLMPTHANLLVGFLDPTSVVKKLGISPFDTVWVESVEAGGMSEIRRFITLMQYRPHNGQIRLGVITCYDQLSTEAQNALLKLLEEPPQFVTIVLFVSTIAGVLPTVRSRCQVVYAKSDDVTLPFSDGGNRDGGETLDTLSDAEALAKSERLFAVVEQELHRCYREWSQAGRSVKSVDKVENCFKLYHNLKSTINKRILLEQYVLTQL